MGNNFRLEYWHCAAAGNKDECGESENWFAILSPMGEAGAGENLLGKLECSDFSEESGSKNINYQVRLLFFHEYYILVRSILTIPLRGLITCWN